ncbi:MAG: ROK family protein [Ruminococcaceae bacterium]|nr:ROK family protein [Oscillospiraceae bacterium]
MYRIGVDLGGTNIAVGLVNEKIEIISKKSTPTIAERPNEEIVADIAKLCNEVCTEAGIAIADVESVGIASPGLVDQESGMVVYSNNLGMREFPMIPLLRERIGTTNIYLENDANAAAWGEVVVGAAKGCRNAIMITLGTGVGGGIIADGKIYKGFNSAGGELGHTVICVDGRPCTCGRRGCWETYSSATGLIKTTKEKLDECEKAGRPTKMTDLIAEKGKLNGRTAFDAMRAGDEAGTQVVEEYTKYLAIGLANMINIFQPEVILIGGGISNEGQTLVDLLFPEVKKQTYGSAYAPNSAIRIAALKNDAGIIGAAALGLELSV